MSDNAEEFIEEFPEFGEALLKHFDGDITEARISADNYCGTYNTVQAYIEELVTDIEGISDWLFSYVNFKQITQDMEDDLLLLIIDADYNRIHVFR